MTVVLIDLRENERRVSSPVKSLWRAICQAHKPSETRLESVTEIGDRSRSLKSYSVVCGFRGAGQYFTCKRASQVIGGILIGVTCLLADYFCRTNQ